MNNRFVSRQTELDPKPDPPSFRDNGRVRSSELVNKIVDQIEIGILFGEYKPREHLVQDQLAEKYGVERNIIRAALKKLEERSVIEHFHNRGSMVKEMTAKQAKDLYQLRFLLERAAAEMAVALIAPQTIEQLETLNEKMKESLRKGKLREFILAHEKFHQLIFDSADNAYLSKIIRELISGASSIRYFSYSRYSLPETKNHLFEEHRQLISYLKKGDKQKIGEVSVVHIKGGVNHYLKNFFPREKILE